MVEADPTGGSPAPEPPAAAPAGLTETVTAQLATAPAMPVTAADALGWPPALGDEALSARALLFVIETS